MTANPDSQISELDSERLPKTVKQWNMVSSFLPIFTKCYQGHFSLSHDITRTAGLLLSRWSPCSFPVFQSILPADCIYQPALNSQLSHLLLLPCLDCALHTGNKKGAFPPKYNCYWQWWWEWEMVLNIFETYTEKLIPFFFPPGTPKHFNYKMYFYVFICDRV